MKNSFFKVVSCAEFRDLLLKFPKKKQFEIVKLNDSVGRIAYEDIYAKEDLPLANRSTMDGYAVWAEDTFGSTELTPAFLEISGHYAIDETPKTTLKRGECVEITTGGVLPKGANAVVMVEHTEMLGETAIEVRKSVAPKDNLMLQGEDIRKGEIIIKAGTKVRGKMIGLLASQGFFEIIVHKKPKIGIISTGDELINIENTPRIGQVRDVNSYTLGNLVQEAGGISNLYGIIPDNLAEIILALKRAIVENDIVFISGGSSVGARDFTIAAIESLPKSKILTHGVSISPGKPTILANVDGKAVLGLPGQVTSAQIIMYAFACPLVQHLAGKEDVFSWPISLTRFAKITENISAKQGREEYIRVSLELKNNVLYAIPRQGKSGLLKTIFAADGFIKIDQDCEGLVVGSDVVVYLFS